MPIPNSPYLTREQKIREWHSVVNDFRALMWSFVRTRVRQEQWQDFTHDIMGIFTFLLTYDTLPEWMVFHLRATGTRCFFPGVPVEDGKPLDSYNDIGGEYDYKSSGAIDIDGIPITTVIFRLIDRAYVPVFCAPLKSYWHTSLWHRLNYPGAIQGFRPNEFEEAVKLYVET